MPEYLSPGVYVEEVPSGMKPIEGVGTSTGGFVGIAEKGPFGEAKLITNWSQFVRTFGGFIPNGDLAYAVRDFFTEGGTRCYVVRTCHYTGITDPTTTTAKAASVMLRDRVDPQGDAIRIVASSEGTWGQGIKIKIADATEDTANKFKLTVWFKEGKDPVETFDELSMNTDDPDYVETRINGASEYIRVEDQKENNAPGPDDRPASTPPGGDPTPLAGTADDDGLAGLTDTDFIGDGAAKNGLHAFDPVDDVNIIAVPGLPGVEASSKAILKAGCDYCEGRGDCFFVGETPDEMDPQEVVDFKETDGLSSSYGALYYPWIKALDPLTGKPRPLPPSGAIVGTYASTDVKRGVHKAPAGITDGRLSALSVERVVTKGEHDTLNPKGINVIRSFPTGVTVWGARTLSADPEWRYINVRRLLLFLEESIEEGTQWVVFEPNDFALWQKIKRNVSAFLYLQWLNGALVGKTPKEAYYVKCDEETNPPEVVDAGRVVTEIGVAPSKPAEFVIFKISQWRAGSSVSET